MKLAYKVYLARKDYEQLCYFAKLYCVGSKKPNLSLLLELIAKHGFSVTVNGAKK